MSKIIQSTTFRLVANHDEALEEVKRVKKFMEAKGVGVRAF
jgi:ubiquinone/menaquinone biosynthesis C-methylase UbiE